MSADPLPARKNSVLNETELRSQLLDFTAQAGRIQDKASFGSRLLTESGKKGDKSSDKLHVRNSVNIHEGLCHHEGPCQFTECDDDEDLASNVFDRLVACSHERACPDGSGESPSLSLSALRDALQRCKTSEGERAVLDDVMFALEDGEANAAGQHLSESVDFKTFFSAFRTVPRVRGERVRWAASLGLEGVLSRLLPRGDAADGLRGLRELNPEGEAALAQRAAVEMALATPRLIKEGLTRLRATAKALEELVGFDNGKFLADGAALGRYATLGDFYRGPEAILGAPNPRIRQGIEDEHCGRPNADSEFTSTYNVVTTPKLEWEFVVNPDRNKNYSRTASSPVSTGGTGRVAMPLKELLAQPAVAAQVAKAELRDDEVVCLRLYTGPMFLLYNIALRGLPASGLRHLKGNMFETTIFVISSGIAKLSKVAAIPAGRLLYRGMQGGLVLPDQFWRVTGPCWRRIELIVQAGGLEAAQRAADALKEMVQAEPAATERCGFLVLPSAGIRVSVVSMPQAYGKSVRMAVVLPTEVHQGTEVRAEPEACQRIVEAVRACCGGEKRVLDVVWEEVPRDFRGGVEFGLLSLTESREVAMNFGSTNKGRRGTLFEVQVRPNAVSNFCNNKMDNHGRVPELACYYLTATRFSPSLQFHTNSLYSLALCVSHPFSGPFSGTSPFLWPAHVLLLSILTITLSGFFIQIRVLCGHAGRSD
jgi:hypothetical protein